MAVRGPDSKLRAGLALAWALALPAGAAAMPRSAVDTTYRGSRATITVEGDRLVLDARDAAFRLRARVRDPRPLRVAAGCSADVLAFDIFDPLDGRDAAGLGIVAPDPEALRVAVGVPGLGERLADGADGCRMLLAEPRGGTVAEVAVGFTPAVQAGLRQRTLRTRERDSQALADAQAAITSALTTYVNKEADLSSWGPTPEGRVPREVRLRLRTIASTAAAARRPVVEDLVYLVVPPGRPRARSAISIIAPSTAEHGRLVIIRRDFATGYQRYEVRDRRGLRLRFAGDEPPFAAERSPGARP